MPNPLNNLLKNQVVASVYGRAALFVAGIARDFWKDGSETPFGHVWPAKKSASPKPKSPPPPGSFSAAMDSVMPSTAPGEWHALPGAISEKMWGDGFVLPGGDTVTDMLLKPLGLTQQMNVLDLSAGLGGLIRRAAQEFGATVTGLEPDAGIASREKGSVIPYSAENFAPGKTVTQLYDCVIAREVFYRVTNKAAFFESLAACTKPYAQITFTDYIVNPEDRKKPAIVKWIAHENATPLGLVEMAEVSAKAGFQLRVHDDQTAYYQKEIFAGLQRFVLFLKTGIRPDAETRKAILRRMETWTLRLAAIEQGMKFYRFYGTK